MSLTACDTSNIVDIMSTISSVRIPHHKGFTPKYSSKNLYDKIS